MTFNSVEFCVFFSFIMVLYAAVLKNERARDLFLLSVSYIFYSAWYWEYSLLILSSTCVDYFIGRKIHNSENVRYRKWWLIASLVFNLGLLGVFKYFNFFAKSATELTTVFGYEISPIQHQLLLPIGISFYTFQTLSYTLDIYRKKIQPEKNFIKFAVFVSFFPQLVAGPIVRAIDFLPQLHKKLDFTIKQANTGLFLIFSGLFKKIVIADTLALLVIDDVFAEPSLYSSLDVLIALYAYSLQIYCDFSGYSDVAIGIALLLGFHLPINFNRPYLSKDPGEFWTRWHISLSSWLRDYLYISMGGNKKGEWITKRNLLVTMLLGGLWHGAAINFILWGAFHGLILIIFRPYKAIIAHVTGWKKLLSIACTFHLILFGWLLFRVPDMDIFKAYISAVMQLNFNATVLSPLCYIIIALGFVWHWVPPDSFRKPFCDRFISLPVWFQSGCYTCLLILFSGLSLDTPQFLYFQF